MFSIAGAVMQFNLETFDHVRTAAFFRTVSRRAEVVLGGDLHGAASFAALRPDRAMKAAARALPNKEAGELVDRERRFLSRAVSIL